MFTSNASDPDAGNWGRIYFERNTITSDDPAQTSYLKYCTIEYGGYGGYGNIRLYKNNGVVISNCEIGQSSNYGIRMDDTSATIQHSTIRSGTHSGIYVNGNGCDNAFIYCNNIIENMRGIYTTGGAQPLIINNNFMNNTRYGVVNGSSNSIVTADENWWNDPAGPNQGGDAINEYVDVQSFLTSLSTCVSNPPPAVTGITPANGSIFRADNVPALIEAAFTQYSGGVDLGNSQYVVGRYGNVGFWKGEPEDKAETWEYTLADGVNLPAGEYRCAFAAYDADNGNEISLRLEGPETIDVFAGNLKNNGWAHQEGTFTITTAGNYSLKGRQHDDASYHWGLASASIQSKDSNPVNGSWVMTDDNHLVFTPAGVFTEAAYQVTVHLRDEHGNAAPFPTISSFTVDTTSPAAPGIYPVTSPTNADTQVIRGTKESGAAVFLNGAEVVGHTASPVWEYTASLTEGTNSFVFTMIDQAGNSSNPSESVEILYDNTVPEKVTELTADGAGEGSAVSLAWNGYDESAQGGDIDHYAVYLSQAEFSDVAALGEPRATVPAGTFTCQVTGLTKGTTYWLAVVAVDDTGLFEPAVTPVSAVPTDVVPPDEVSGLSVSQCLETALTFSWTASAASDLAGYRVYFDGAATFEEVAADQTAWEKTGLSPASGHSLKITAVDGDGNESDGVTLAAATLLDSPAGLTAEAFDGYMELAWSAAAPADLVRHYAVYVTECESAGDFDSVAGLEPVLTTGKTTARVAGLTNGRQYCFAVTTVNISNGQKTGVTAVSATPEADTSPPQIDAVTCNGVPLAGSTVTASGTIQVELSDPAGVSRVALAIVEDALGQTVFSTTDYTAPYTCALDIHALNDGPHTLEVTAWDTLDNNTSPPATFSFTIDMPPPAPPVITGPAGGYVTNQPELTVSGTAEKTVAVTFYDGSGTEMGPGTAADVSGHFTGQVTL
ncbi:MAG: fibronectin type III domain-containing protein, partial [Desulfosudaceae bacterium]